MLDPVHSRGRQRRLLQILQDRKLDAAVMGLSCNVCYLAGHLPFWQHHAALILFADGKSVLYSANEPEVSATADGHEFYEATWNGTQRQDQAFVLAGAVAGLISDARTIGIDCSAVTSALAATSGRQCLPLDTELWQLRRRKDPDELALMKKAIDCTRVMYEWAGRIMEPGISETMVFSEMHTAAVEAAGEPLSAHLGNDYACGVPGGPPRKDHTARAGQLYILDLGPAYRGYFADNCRTFSVNRKPTAAQLKAWEIVTGVFPIVERIAKAGVRCRDIYQAVDDYYRSAAGKPFPHHLGHGVGLQPHEYPHLNPKWDDVLMEGEVFTCEPGLYSDELAGGLRIENQYLVRADGVENLTPFAMEMD